MLKTQLPGCFWASLSCTWTPWCAPCTTSCKGIQPWCAFALLKDLHEWNRCWWGLKELLRSLFVSAENAGNSGIRCLWASVKGGGDPSPTPPPRHRAPALCRWSFNEGACRWKSYLLLLKDPTMERSTPAEVEQDRQTWLETVAISWNAFSCQQNSHLQL